MLEQQAAKVRRQIIEKRFARMNAMQLDAVTTVNGPLLILAGAGSGKTTVLVNRIACILAYGDAYRSDQFARPVDEQALAALEAYRDGDERAYFDAAPYLQADAPAPWQILAITFTNKAAGELKDRIAAMLPDMGADVWAGTFHSVCVRFLRKDGDRLGYTSHFTIYDTDDQLRVIKESMRALNIDEKVLSPKTAQRQISKAKDELLTPDAFLRRYGENNSLQAMIGNVFRQYQQRLMQADAMDFDDIIVNAVTLLREHRDVREYYQNKFRYVMVDEYQDTNIAQYHLTSLLAGQRQNLCVVGDDDQSIYRFRGATIENILKFELQYPNAKVIRLEQNYRSTQNILDAANAVIANNTERKGKTLWTDNGAGDRILVKTLPSDLDEASFIADSIMDSAAEGLPFADHAVLYRTNNQSNLLEKALVRRGIPYRIIGGHRFYERKEIKDLTAYLAVICNPDDSVRLRRIINVPARGIGETTVNNAAKIADALRVSLYEVLRRADEFPVLSRAKARLKPFCDMMDGLIEMRDSADVTQLFEALLDHTGYREYLALDQDTYADRMENVNELLNNIVRFADENPEDPSLDAFLEDVALMSDIDNYNADADAVVLMTIHSAKGLEFPCVYIAGMEDGIFPGQQSMYSSSDMEEERRLAYVGITRAKKKLTLTNAKTRMMFGRTVYFPPSAFLEEIPQNNKRVEGLERRASYHFAQDGGSGYAGGAYGNARQGRYDAPASQPRRAGSYVASGQTAPRKPVAKCDLRPGDRVKHRKFGAGTVLTADALGNDTLLEVAFDDAGTKKLMANAARLEKL